jgi:hypothetical protein
MSRSGLLHLHASQSRILCRPMPEAQPLTRRKRARCSARAARHASPRETATLFPGSSDRARTTRFRAPTYDRPVLGRLDPSLPPVQDTLGRDRPLARSWFAACCDLPRGVVHGAAIATAAMAATEGPIGLDCLTPALQRGYAELRRTLSTARAPAMRAAE